MLYIVDLESVESRYTYYWKTSLPNLFSNNGIYNKTISGTEPVSPPRHGQFLNFAGTNIYKSEQVQKIATLFEEGKIKPNDQFLFTDAWHPGVLNLRYMSDLTNIPVRIHALWHAGNYDKNDFLGRLGKTSWLYYTELALFHSCHLNYFATQYHRSLFTSVYQVDPHCIVQTGWPMEYIQKIRSKYVVPPVKDNLVIFPHRLAPEKQVDVFKEIAKRLPEYEFVICQEKNLTKDQYYDLLGRAKVVFSANLQETLGISMYEGVVFGATPVVPDYLSYDEMYPPEVKYPASWILGSEKKIDNLAKVVDNAVKNYAHLVSLVEKSNPHKFFNADVLVEKIKEFS